MDLTGIGSVAEFARSIIDRIFPAQMDPAEKAQKQLQLQEMLQRRDSDLLAAQKSIIVAEMQQSDSYTKRARPTIVYFGLAAIGLVHVLFPIIACTVQAYRGMGIALPDISLPGEFWATWGGVCGIWIVGRTAEKRGSTGMAGKIAGMITGK